MSGEKDLKPWVKPALEYVPLIVFMIAYFLWKDQVFTWNGSEYDGFIVATALFIPLLVISTLILWKLTGHLSKMQIMTLVLVIGFGGISVWLNDGTFFKMKPTILYLFFAGALGVGLLQGKSYMQVMMDAALPLTDAGWMELTKRITLFFIVLAVANEVVWRFFSEGTWVLYKFPGTPILMFVFFIFQGKLLEEHSTEDKDAG